MEVSPMSRLVSSLVVLLAVAGCKKSEPVAAAPIAPVANQAAPVAAPVAAPGAPVAPGAEGAAAGNSVKGKILERIDAKPYSYLRLATDKGEVWAAVPETKLEKGTEASVVNAMPMTGFESKTLNKKFDLVYFGTLAGAAGAAPMGGAPAPGPMGGAMGGAMGAMEGGAPNVAAQHANVSKGSAEVGNVQVEKATGADARTVAEVYAQKTKLAEKPVTIRGKVVKYNGGIMGKNWFHLRDGSGKAEANDNDLTVTSQETAKVGDVIVVKGVVRMDKDFGAGYAYPVIVEDATIAK
jgi:membrane protein implicated in regulation of membrane protease activity